MQKKKFGMPKSRSLKGRWKSSITYALFEDLHRLREKIVLRQMVKCSSNIEVQNYSSKIFSACMLLLWS